MKFIKHFTLFFCLLLLFNCSSEDDCAKIIIIQNEFTVTTASGITVIPEISQTVDCTVPAPNVAQTIEELPKLQEFSYNITFINNMCIYNLVVMNNLCCLSYQKHIRLTINVLI